MTGALFLAEFDTVEVGQRISVGGEEARHATVKRIELGEEVVVANGRGLGFAGPVRGVTREELVVEVARVLRDAPARRVVAVQALAKGDRSLLAVQMLTEVGAHQIVAWQSDRCIVRWSGERGEKSLAKWTATARESAKQARRLTTPDVLPATNRTLGKLLVGVGTILVLHEAADRHIRDAEIVGDVAVVVGPEGGISPDELAMLAGLGGQPVRISDHVLRTSTAGAVAIGQLEVL
ncbi:16S rRNA (uracil(1498)-N(3))-methyltransferase [Tessaracoccus sp. OH4464_COT-324]|uniref:16S rRNA (uracil(1498)-N(3))-methyltransferase n=1 Tax=Tessaracoccus sp. OH4464_COT-324 TaxID=2491059 RepID=UPI000F63C49D|nr:16S rRNA (uracil(1498)-N(3))-methyltransferase [Tessaracoccus sp. OH4464_COT-324]RRD47822.1 16S rRNA (uracil(1498)-N(3))-methyltransferase [Tessaracoccus sp. OH4464_COT-324]